MIKPFAFGATLWRKAVGYWRTLWVRVMLMGAIALLAIGLTQLIEPLLPRQVSALVGGAQADRLLDVIANAMLAATIFALTVMVTVYRSTASQWTPRVHRLIMQDPTTQNTLATFIGAWVFSLTAIILREVGVFGDDDALVLFVLTVLVIVLIVFALIRWTVHLQTFGSLIDTTRQVEEITRRQFRERLRTPCLGAHPLRSRSDIPDDASPVRAEASGYVTTLYQESLNAAAAEREIDIYIVAPPGSFVHVNQPLAWVTGDADPEEAQEERRTTARLIRDHLTVEDVRGYEQDPRLGLIVMGEIGSKALSPGINDPGTAIDVITRIARILSDYEGEARRATDPVHDRLHVPPLDPSDLIEDGYGSIARDGAGMIEVQQRLQKVLSGLMQHPDEGLARAAKAAAVLEFRRAMEALSFDHDRQRLERVTPDPVVAAASER